MKPAKLRKHLESCHPENVADALAVLQQKKARFEKDRPLSEQELLQKEKPLLEASYKVAHLIAKNKKPHTIGETLIKPCALEMVELVCGTEQRMEIAKIPLSNDVIHSRIEDMSTDIVQQVIRELKESPLPFSMQLDESTDVAQYSQLLVFVRYVNKDSIKEEFLFCEPLSGTTKAIDIFNHIEEFFALHDFADWTQKLGSICTDGAPAMLGNKSGFAALVKAEAPHVVVTHCILHRQALASKTLPQNLTDIMSTAVKVVNFIRARATNHRLFKQFCEAVGSNHDVLLYHTEVRWLSRGIVLSRLMELRAEVSGFLHSKQSNLCAQFDDPEFVVGLAYLADIFSHLNNLNRSIQGPNMTAMDAGEMLNAFLEKLPLWKRRLEKNNFSNFPTLGTLLLEYEATEESLSHDIKEHVANHLTALQKSFDNYFMSSSPKPAAWIRNPFIVDMSSVDDDDMAKDDLIDMRAKEMIQHEFQTKNLGDFWCSMMEVYPILAKQALQSIIPFATTYLCEAGFSTLLVIKTKARNRLDAVGDIRIALSKTIPRFDVLVSSRQQQSSH